MVTMGSVLVVVASTLTGGLRNMSVLESIHPSTNNDTAQCALPKGDQCAALDATILPLHFIVPWGLTLSVLVCMGMPSVLLWGKDKEQGMRVFAGNLFQYLGLLLCSLAFANRTTVSFALTLHSCTRLLLSTAHSGGWLALLVLLGLQLSDGPPVSVVPWIGGQEGTIRCAYLSHLTGCVLPDLVLGLLRCLIASARYIHVSGDTSI
jgi:hypothetical protein